MIRHATLVVEIAGLRIMVDPMLGSAGTDPPIPNTPNQKPNPLVGLPFEDDDLARLVQDVDAVLVTHTHADHWDEKAQVLIPADKPILCQPEDEAKISDSESGFSNVFPVTSELDWNGLRFIRTGGQHGTGEVGARMAPVSGFVVLAEGPPSLYLAGDTVWCREVEEALLAHRPEVVVVNAGAAQFLEGGPITMTAEDVARVRRTAPEARVIAVHMDAINHCLLTKSGLEESLQAQGLAGKVDIPADGETLEVPA